MTSKSDWKSKSTLISLIILIIAIVAMAFINVKYERYRQNKVNNNPLSSQRIVFERFGVNDIDISNTTYSQLIKRVDTVMARNDHLSEADVHKIIKYQIYVEGSKKNLEKDMGKTKVDKLLKDMNKIEERENITKIHSDSKLKKGSKVTISINLPQEIIQKYHIDTTPRKITVSKIINGKKFILDR